MMLSCQMIGFQVGRNDHALCATYFYDLPILGLYNTCVCSWWMSSHFQSDHDDVCACAWLKAIIAMAENLTR